MSAIRDANRYALLLYLSAAALTAELVHLIVYAFDDGIAPSFAEAMAFGGHHSYFLAAFAVTAIALAMAIVLSPLDLKTIRSRASGRRFALAWLAMMVVGSIGFLVLENLETLHGDHPLAGLSPTHWMIDPGVPGHHGAGVRGHRGRRDHPDDATAYVLCGGPDDVLRGPRRDGRLRRGVPARRLGDGLLRRDPPGTAGHDRHAAAAAGPRSRGGHGVLARQAARRGRRPLCHRAPRVRPLGRDGRGGAPAPGRRPGSPRELAVGDILDDDAYAFPPVIRHDIVFAYDVVQQLPRELQDGAVTQLYRHVADGGWLVIFDHDAASRYGRTMGLKKWLRRHLGIPLVPYHYIHSRYPSMAHLRRLLQGAGAVDIAIAVEAEGRHRALLARRSGDRS